MQVPRPIISTLAALALLAPGLAAGQAVQVPRNVGQLIDPAAASGDARNPAVARASLGLASATAGARAATWTDSFARYPDGAWTGGTTAAGQAWTFNAAQTGATVSTGRLTNAGAATGAWYAWGDVGAGATVVRHSATVRFGSAGTTQGSACALAIGNQLNTLDSLIHCSLNSVNSISLTLLHNVSGSLAFDPLTDASGLNSIGMAYSSPLSYDTDYTVAISILGNTAWVEFPDGQCRAFTDSRISSWAGRYFFIETTNGAATDHQGAIAAVAVDSTAGAPAPAVGLAAATPQSVPRLVQAAAGQTAPLDLLVDSAGQGLGARTARGAVGVGTGTPQAMLEVVPAATGLAGVRVSPRPGQLAPMLQSDGLNLASTAVQQRWDFNGNPTTYITRFGALTANNAVAQATASISGLFLKSAGATQSADLLKVQDNASHDYFGFDKVGRPVAYTQAPAPTIAAGAGAGTSPTVTLVSATDVGGTISIATGTTPAAGATLTTITFGTAWGSKPKTLILTPANAAAAGLGAYEDQPSRSAGAFAIKSGSTVPAASTTYLFSFEVRG